MMVDGSPRRTNTPPHHSSPEPNNTTSDGKPKQEGSSPKDQASVNSNAFGTGIGNSGDPSGSTAPSTNVDPTGANRTSRSRWLKLRTTVQLSGAITQVHKKPPLKREDSFLKRFSTRHIPDPCSVDGFSRHDDSRRVAFFGSWRSVVNPDENILFYWLSLLTACLLYNSWTIIARQAFPELQHRMGPVWFAADGFTDLVFILDIAFQFRTGYLEQGLMVYETAKLAGHYFKSRPFVMDLIAVTPLDFLQFHTGLFPILRFPRFLKVYRSFRFYYMVESRTIYPNLWRVVNLIHILLLLAHWFGCFYYMLSEFEEFKGEWAYHEPVGDYATLARKYLGSVYWSTLTLTTIGDLATPATNLQYLFTIVSYLIGVFIFATIVGQVGNVITNRNASRLEFERLLDGAKLYMRHHKVPRNMQRRVQRWYDYSWSRGRMQGGGDINSALGILPDKLKTELALHVNLKTLKKVSIFQECQPEFLHDLVLKMKAYIFTPGDLICRKGEVAREMFIIADGVLEVISETGKVLTQMKAGDFFGEIGILNLDGFNRRTADVRSVGYSELFSLSREDILTAMKDYPEAQEILQTMGRKRLMEARLAATMNKKEEQQGSSAKRSGGNVIDPGKKGSVSQRPRTAVSKLKEDVRSLKKLLRSRSTPSGKACLQISEEQVEMKAIPPNSETDQQGGSDNVRFAPGVRKASLKTLMKRIHFKGDSESSHKIKAGLASRFSSNLSRLRDSECRSPTRSRTDSSTSAPTSTESADSNTPLNKGLPLLQRIRLLGEQEKVRSAGIPPARTQSTPAAVSDNHSPPLSANESSTQEVIGEGLPLLERLKLLSAREKAQAAVTTPLAKDAPQSTAVFKSKLGKNVQIESAKILVPPSTKKLSLSTRIASAVGAKNANASNSSPEARTSVPLVQSTSVPIKSRTDLPSELPLLKKVLLMKMMEDKKTDVEPVEVNTKSSEKKIHFEGLTQRDSEIITHSNEPSSTNNRLGIISKVDTMVESKRTMTRPESKLVISTVTSQADGHYGPMSSSGMTSTLAIDNKSSKRTSNLLLQSDQKDLRNSRVNISQQVPIDCHTVPTTRSNQIVDAANTISVASASDENIPSETAASTISAKVNNSQIKKPKSPGSDSKNTENDDALSLPKHRVRKDSTTTELLRSNTDEGYAARKGKLSRMMALREDSDEHGSDVSSSDIEDEDNVSSCSDDPFVKNIECQTEVHHSTSTSPDTWSSQELKRHRLKAEDFPNAANKRSHRTSVAGSRNADKKKEMPKVSVCESQVPLSDDGIQDYLVKVMKNVKQAIKTYVLEQQQELQNRVLALEKEVREKDAIIRELKTTHYTQSQSSASNNKNSNTFDEVSSLDLSLDLSSSDSESEHLFQRPIHPAKGRGRREMETSTGLDEGDDEEEEEEDDIKDPEEIEQILKMQRSMSQRKSWTYGGSNSDLATRIQQRRKKLLSSRQSYSLDDEKSQIVTSGNKAGQLWKLEFPIPESGLSSTSSYGETIAEPITEGFSEIYENIPEEVADEEEEEEMEEKISPVIVLPPVDEFSITPNTGSGGNDWEVQMLVEQFEKNIKQQKRRHSSGEVLSWQAVLGSRLGQNTTSSDPRSEISDVASKTHRGSGRKLSLVESSLCKPWDCLQKSAPKQRSMWHLPCIVANPGNHSTPSTKSKLSQGESTDAFRTNLASVPQKVVKTPPLDKKTNARRRVYRHRRQNSFSEIKPPQHPRKSSLPSVESLNNVSVSRWSSGENSSLSYAKRSSQSSNQRDNVISVDSRFGSLDDVSRTSTRKNKPWPRSPSSPNFTTADQQFWDFATMSEQSIPEWPSSPCLPTITEDDHSAVPSLTSSPCRSFSHDCIPTLPTSPLWSTSNVLSSNPWTFPSKEEFSGSYFKQSTDTPKADVRVSADNKSVKLREAKDLDDSRLIPFAQSREDSVVIAIPECEPLLSPR